MDLKFENFYTAFAMFYSVIIVLLVILNPSFLIYGIVLILFCLISVFFVSRYLVFVPDPKIPTVCKSCRHYEFCDLVSQWVVFGDESSFEDECEAWQEKTVWSEIVTNLRIIYYKVVKRW